MAGSDAVHTHAVEKTLADAELLNPNSAFVVVDCARHRGFVWVCRWANEHEKKHTKEHMVSISLQLLLTFQS